MDVFIVVGIEGQGIMLLQVHDTDPQSWLLAELKVFSDQCFRVKEIDEVLRVDVRAGGNHKALNQGTFHTEMGCS